MISFDQTGLPLELEHKMHLIIAKLMLKRNYDEKEDLDGTKELDKTHTVEYDFKYDIIMIHTLKKIKNKMVDVDLKRFKNGFLYEHVWGNGCSYNKLAMNYNSSRNTPPEYYIHGHYHRYHPNGVLAEESLYYHNVKQGKSREWDDDGIRKSLTTFAGSDFYGYHIDYNKEGKKIKEGFKLNGVDFGEYQEFDGHDFPTKHGFIQLNSKTKETKEYTIKQAKKLGLEGPWLDHKHNLLSWIM
jgi:hypothetical protein